MTVRIAPLMAMANQYGGMVGWAGDLVIHTVHGAKKTYRVPAGIDVALSEVGVLVSWPGDEPSGKFIPYGEITAIDQVPDGEEDVG
jgi:hypothetical protein